MLIALSIGCTDVLMYCRWAGRLLCYDQARRPGSLSLPAAGSLSLYVSLYVFTAAWIILGAVTVFIMSLSEEQVKHAARLQSQSKRKADHNKQTDKQR